MQYGLTEDDLALVHALQLHPRAGWASLGPVLGCRPAALARRWLRLRSHGLAWVTSYPAVTGSAAPVQIALVEVDCAPGRLDEVAARLDAEPAVMTSEHADRGRDLVLTVNAGSFAQMSALLLDRIGQVPGVVSTRAHLSAGIHLEGSRWRLDALDAAQIDAVRALHAADRVPAGPRPDPFSATFAPLTRELSRDGRVGATEIARRIGRPSSTVRRQLAALLRSGALVFRCEVAQLLTRWPVCVTWWMRMPTASVEAAVLRLRQDARVRLCLSLTGPANLLVTAWAGSMADLVRMQHQLEALLPDAQIVDASVILRTRKRMGWLLHPDGRCTGEVVPLTAPA
ncbi:Lrp/AsnC family transcriptional regulator [Pseudonocardia sp. KRD291]|uniref:Lrp/AsnC family transcriptional regulator n=1 Tax=Pseudonocardia sp. KRD291 TaxID=2792007 RepID=UPI001C4A42CF|nr:Lrp/AsnC family transcriptional regulator [Pseudonocardia sp. KRD291]MBW0101258.1 Lrp/AsnC family transcriptional regulator [Pseudonocardia sp. KRD291]